MGNTWSLDYSSCVQRYTFACQVDVAIRKGDSRDMVVSQNKGTPISQNIITLIIGTPKKVPLLLGNPHMQD